MGLPLFLAATSTILGISASNKSAKAQQLQAERQAKQMEIDRKLAEAQAVEIQNQRVYEYNYARSSNNAQFSFNIEGGESSSLAAFEQYQELTMGTDIAASQRQSGLDSGSRSVAAMIERQRGTSARSVARINTLSDLFDLGSMMSKTYVPKTYTPTEK
jgi:hypothetical protein